MLFERESDSIKGNPKRFPFLNKEQKGQERMDKKKMRKVLQKLALLGIIASLSAFTLGGCQKTTESKETQTEAKSEAKADETKQEEETESTDKAENTEKAKDTDKAEEKTDETEEKQRKKQKKRRQSNLKRQNTRLLLLMESVNSYLTEMEKKFSLCQKNRPITRWSLITGKF